MMASFWYVTIDNNRCSKYSTDNIIVYISLIDF